MGLNEMFKKIAAIESEKTELSKYEIDLGAAEDLAKALSDLQANMKAVTDEKAKYKIADDAITKAKAEVLNASTNADKVQANGDKLVATLYKNLLKYAAVLDKIEKQAKEFGIDPKQIPNYTMVDKLYSTLDAEIKSLNSYTWINN
jgi:hypothetical protein